VPDAIKNPAHYQAAGLDVIDVIEGWGLGPHLANACKYILRAERKGNALQDLHKARWCLQRLIDKPNVPLTFEITTPTAPGFWLVAQKFNLTEDLQRCLGCFLQLRPRRTDIKSAIAFLNSEISDRTQAAKKEIT
jgi:Protein of unknwon function (DUF3310)